MIQPKSLIPALRRVLPLAALIAAAPAAAQSILVHQGQIATAFAQPTDEMTFSEGGATLSISGKAFAIADIDSVTLSSADVAENTVTVTYSGSTASVVVSGNAASYLTISVSGANVSIIQADDLAEEITYVLQGASSNGSFYMDGELKATVQLNGLSLTSTSGAAINIDNGKRISIELVDGTTNVLADAANGSQKACFMVNGHSEFKGGGSLTLTGNTKHAFWGDEYVELKKSTGTITVTKAVSDGFNINQYFEMKGGTVSISGVGDDGIDVGATDNTDDEQNGEAIISGGTLSITNSATAGKGLKCDNALTISDGTITITTSGAGQYDSSDADVSGAACLKSGGTATISGGTLTLKSTGTGGKGINASGNISITGGTIDITTTGKQYTYSRYSTSPKGIRAGGTLTIDDGAITVSCTGGEGSEGIESKSTLTINGGDIISKTYDDAINAAKAIVINGGRIYAYASNNDGIDSNGTLTITGGLAISVGTTSPEEGFDCDNNTFKITGGTIIGIGGSTSSPTTSVTTQPVVKLSGQSLTSGQYIALNTSSGTNIWYFQMPRTISSATLLLSSPSMSTGSSYTFLRGATASGATTTWQGYSTGGTATGGTSTTFTQSSIVTTAGSSSGGGGGWGPGGGGGGGRW